MSGWIITFVTLLMKSIAKKNTPSRTKGEFITMKLKVTDKTHTSKHSRREIMERPRVEDQGIWDLVI